MSPKENIFGDQITAGAEPLLVGGAGEDVDITWETDLLQKSGGSGVDVIVTTYGEESSKPVDEVIIAEGLRNSGHQTITLPKLPNLKHSSGGILGDEVHTVSIKVGSGLANSIRLTGTTNPPPTVAPVKRSNTSGAHGIDPVLVSNRIVHVKKPTTAKAIEDLCTLWSNGEENPDWVGELPPCPNNQGQLAAEEGLWEIDPFCNERDSRTQTDCCCKLFRPGARHCVKQR